MLYLPKRDLDHVQIFFWISSNFPPNFQCLWSYNVLSATHQHCKHLKDKGKNLAAPRSFFSILRDPSTHICVIQPLNIWKPCTRQLSSSSTKRTLWEMAINIYFPYFLLALCSVAIDLSECAQNTRYHVLWKCASFAIWINRWRKVKQLCWCQVRQHFCHPHHWHTNQNPNP